MPALHPYARPQAQVQPGLVAVEVSATGVFFHGLPRIREIEVAGRPWAPKRRVVGAPGCGGGGGGGASAPGAGCGCAARPAADDFGQENDVEAPPAAPTPIISTPIPVLTGGGAGASALIASLQQPVVLPMQPVLEAGVAPEECAGGPTAATNSARGGCDSYSAARGCSEVFLFVHGLGEDFGNGHVRMFGQMIALLELPPHIAPLLFCWPSGVVRRGRRACLGGGGSGGDLASLFARSHGGEQLWQPPPPYSGLSVHSGLP